VFLYILFYISLFDFLIIMIYKKSIFLKKEEMAMNKETIITFF